MLGSSQGTGHTVCRCSARSCPWSSVLACQAWLWWCSSCEGKLAAELQGVWSVDVSCAWYWDHTGAQSCCLAPDKQAGWLGRAWASAPELDCCYAVKSLLYALVVDPWAEQSQLATAKALWVWLLPKLGSRLSGWQVTPLKLCCSCQQGEWGVRVVHPALSAPLGVLSWCTAYRRLHNCSDPSSSSCELAWVTQTCADACLATATHWLWQGCWAVAAESWT